MIKRLLSKLFSKLFLEKEADIDYLFVDSGIVCKQNDGTTSNCFCWADVDQIESYQIDLFSYDEVALLFEAQNAYFEIRESHSAFHELKTRLHKYFDVNESWYYDAMGKAFEPNRKVLYIKHDHD